MSPDQDPNHCKIYQQMMLEGKELTETQAESFYLHTRVSAVFTHLRLFYNLTYPKPTHGKENNQTAPCQNSSEVIVMFK